MSLLNHNFPAHQAEAIAQVHCRRIISNKKPSQASNTCSETAIKSSENNQTSTLKDTESFTYAPSIVRHFNIQNELLDSMEERKLESYLNMTEPHFTMYEDGTNKAYVSFPIHQVHAAGSMLFCVDTGVSHSCIAH